MDKNRSNKFTTAIGTQILRDGCFFRDGLRRVDYVIVVKEKQLEFLKTYIKNLEDLGLELEIARGRKVERLFILVHLPDPALRIFSNIYDIGLEEKMVYKSKQSPNIFRTRVSDMPAKEEDEFTTAERILIAHKILESTRYSEEENDISLRKLIQQGIIETAYPLHDGPCEFQDSALNLANDRQLLATYWANFDCFYKESPIDLIKKYFGSKIAFYFAWLQFLNVMVLPVALIGVLITTFKAIYVIYHDEYVSTDICNFPNSTFLCPTCLDPNLCRFRRLNSVCVLSKLESVCDNAWNIGFAILMTFWATLFLRLWKRKSNELKWKWGIKYEDKGGERPDYWDTAKWKYAESKGIMVRYIPRHKMFLCYLFSILCVLFMMSVIAGVIFLLIVIKIIIAKLLITAKYTRTQYKLIISTFGSTVALGYIYIFSKLFYGGICIWLTKIENPKTQVEFDKSVTYKKFALTFFNNFANTFYHGFIRGRFHTKPKLHQTFFMSTLREHTCQPLTCMNDVAISLTILILGKKTLTNLMKVIKPTCNKLTCKRPTFQTSSELAQFEEEYFMKPVGVYDLEKKFCEMIILYGFMTFFATACPIAPALGLINILLEQRTEARRYLIDFRRAVPYRQAGIGIWRGILTGETIFSTVTNACMMAFSSEFISREVYRFTKSPDRSLRGYFNTTLSAYAVNDFPPFKRIKPHPKLCWYKAKRYPPWHPNKYANSKDNWKDVCLKFVAVCVFEHILLLANVIFGYFIPDLPYSVRKQMNRNRKLVKTAKLKTLNEQIRTEKRNTTLHKRVNKQKFLLDTVSEI